MSNLKIGRMVLGSFQTNCYFIYREGVQNEEGFCPVILVDPAGDGKYMYDTMRQNGFQVAGVLLTHGHVDHIIGATELCKLSGAKLYAGAEEANLLQDMHLNLSEMFGTPCRVTADVLLRDGEICTIADMSFKVISTPGHTEGGCSYYFEEGAFLISGDTLFEGSVGRTDFPTGSMAILSRSIKNKLFVLPDNTRVYPGHGGSTTIDWEKENNPFVM